MLKLEIQYRNRCLLRELPQSWEECTPQQALACLRLINHPAYSIQRIELEAVQKLLALPMTIFYQVPPADLAAMQQHLQWMYAPSGPAPLIQDFKFRFTPYAMPKAKAENITALEYAIADAFYDEIVENQEDPHLVKKNLVLLTATLARELNPNRAEAIQQGDPRVPLLSREEAEERAKLFQKLPPEYLYNVLRYWQGVKQYVVKLYGQWLFDTEEDPGDEDEDDEFEKAAEPEQNKSGAMFGWWGLYMDIAEKGVFGNLEAVHHTNFHTVCMYIVKQVEAQRQVEKELARQRALISSNKTDY